MKTLTLAVTAALCGLLTLAPCRAQNAPNAVDAPPAQEQTLGIAGFPALEILPGSDEDMAIVVARESPLQGPITYSSGYFTTVKTFTPPKFFSLSIYGYYPKPQWGAIKTVTFKFGDQTWSGKPLYVVAGPDRDRTQDSQNSAYFETLVVQLPPDVARKIVRNKGVLVTTDPKTFYLPISASQLDRLGQLVGSVDAIVKNQAEKGGSPLAAPPPKSQELPGLPISELTNDQTGGKALQTEVTEVANNFAFQVTAYTHDKNKKLATPEIEFLLATVGAKPIWTKITAVTVSYGAKDLQLKPETNNAGKTDDGKSVELMTVTVPYADFVALSQSDKVTITVGNDSYEIDKTRATGVRALAGRLAK